MSKRQKAFVPIDGCFENIQILKEAVHESRKKRREYNIVMLDLAKAFDTVRHDSITEALIRHGVCEGVPAHIMRMYEGATTIIEQNGESTRPIKIRNGVKQGCPLSPLLFNLIMDELLEMINSEPAGIKIDQEKISIMAFADDLVLLTESANDMKILLDKCRDFFDKKGLKANAAKCQGLNAYPLRGRRNHLIASKPSHFWGDVPIPVMDLVSTAKYLGCDVTAKGDVELPEDRWDQWIENIQRAPLKPDQRIRALKTYFIPRITHILRLAECGRNKLKTWTRKVRKSFKKAIHLPEWTPNCWIHHVNGGGLPDLEELIIRLRQTAAQKMTESNDEVAKVVGARVLATSSEKVRAMGLTNIQPKTMKRDFHQRRETALKATHNGESLLYMAQTKRQWLWHGKLWGKSLCNSAKILSGTLPTRINMHRGRCTPENVLCRRCKTTAETDIHVLSECSHNKDAISKRHDRVVKKIGKELAKIEGCQVWMEKTWTVDQEKLKPDISMIQGNKLTLVEVTVPYDRGKETLERREREKVEKYKQIRPDNIAALSERGVIEVNTKAVVIGVSGSIEKISTKNLKDLGLAKHIRGLQMLCLASSADIWSIHENARTKTKNVAAD